MSHQVIGILLGGLAPAVLFGISGIFQKSSNQAGIGPGPYLMCIGAFVVIFGCALFILYPERGFSVRSGLYASLIGICWSAGMALIALALGRYGAPISRLVPLYNMNTLVAVILGLIVFAEWKEVNMTKLLVGSILVIVGGVLVANA